MNKVSPGWAARHVAGGPRPRLASAHRPTAAGAGPSCFKRSQRTGGDTRPPRGGLVVGRRPVAAAVEGSEAAHPHLLVLGPAAWAVRLERDGALCLGHRQTFVLEHRVAVAADHDVALVHAQL